MTLNWEYSLLKKIIEFSIVNKNVRNVFLISELFITAIDKNNVSGKIPDKYKNCF